VTRALALLLVLTACGGGGGSSGDAKDAKDAKDGKDTPPPPPRTRFRYTCAEKQVFDALVAAVRAKSPPLDVADASAGLVTTAFTWHDGRGRPKDASQPILKEDLGLVLELAVVASGGAREVRAHARVFDSGPRGRGPELARDKPGWPAWADQRVALVFVDLDTRLAKCLEQPDE
jgi:hypothetical protein